MSNSTSNDHFSFFKTYHDAQDLSDFQHKMSMYGSPENIDQLFQRNRSLLTPPIVFPAPYFVHDFTNPDESKASHENAKSKTVHSLDTFPYSIGKYNEDRVGLYTQDLFQSQSHPRTIHVGIDFGMPPSSPIYMLMDGQIIAQGERASIGDYGHVIITAHKIENFIFYLLHGHLSSKSIHQYQVGDQIKKGEILAWIGAQGENGGWFPHLHLQCSWLKPKDIDLPGVVASKDRALALSIYFNPLSLFYRFE
jgi:murein DD-endopeptidase MepM/ murein hydrolase activator NlpD